MRRSRRPCTWQPTIHLLAARARLALSLSLSPPHAPENIFFLTHTHTCSAFLIYENFQPAGRIHSQGYRATVPGRVGQTVHDVAIMHGIDIGAQIVGAPMYKIHNDRWTEDLYGEGPQLGHDHVMIPKEWADKMPPRYDQEVRALNENWDEDEINDRSRLACMIHLTKELDGLVVYMPDRVPDDCP